MTRFDRILYSKKAKQNDEGQERDLSQKKPLTEPVDLVLIVLEILLPHDARSPIENSLKDGLRSTKESYTGSIQLLRNLQVDPTSPAINHL